MQSVAILIQKSKYTQNTPTHLHTHLRGPLLNEKKCEPPEKERECKSNVGGESEANVFHLTVLQLEGVCVCVCVCVRACVYTCEGTYCEAEQMK